MSESDVEMEKRLEEVVAAIVRVPKHKFSTKADDGDQGDGDD